MARFKLTANHYLDVVGTEWEQIEIGATGKQVRHRYHVHRLLEIDNPEDWTDKSEKAIIVSNREDSAHSNDLVFVGEPSNEMEPLDDEAAMLVLAVRSRPHPIESLPTTDAVLKAHPQPNAPDPMAKMNQMMAELAAQNSLLQAQVAELMLRQKEAKESEEDDSVGDIPAPKPAISLGGAHA